MGCVDGAQRFLSSILDLLCSSTMKHKGPFRAPATQCRVHKGSKQFFLNITFICNISLFCISSYARYYKTNLDV